MHTRTVCVTYTHTHSDTKNPIRLKTQFVCRSLPLVPHELVVCKHVSVCVCIICFPFWQIFFSSEICQLYKVQLKWVHKYSMSSSLLLLLCLVVSPSSIYFSHVFLSVLFLFDLSRFYIWFFGMNE